jgi:hypothetical protein
MPETTVKLEVPALDETPFPELKRHGAGKSTFNGDRLRSAECTVKELHDSIAEVVAGLVPDGDQDPDALLRQNAELRQKLEQMEELLENSNRTVGLLEEHQKDHGRMLEEKSEVIRDLYQKIQDLQNRPPVELPQEEELLALSEELEHERKQLKDDEDSLMVQMREMEVQMARERAELGRQRNELQQLHNEIRHELERASREAELRARMLPFQRRHQELSTRKGAEPIRFREEAAQQELEVGQEPKAKKDSGILRRLFG